MRTTRRTNVQDVVIGTWLSLILMAGLFNVHALGESAARWDGYAQYSCRFFVQDYPSAAAACAQSAIIKSCNPHRSNNCKDCYTLP